MEPENKLVLVTVKSGLPFEIIFNSLKSSYI